MKKETYNYITMVERAMDIMQLIFEKDAGMGVTEIAKRLELPKATVYRILVTLMKGGYIIKEKDDERYNLGGVFIKYSERVKSDINVHSVAKPHMLLLSEKTGESVNLAVDYDEASLIIERVSGEKTSLMAKLLSDAPYNCSSSGKIFLSHKEMNYIENYFLSGKAKERTVKSITTWERFLNERALILKGGYAIDNEEYDYGLYCIGMPIYSCDNHLMAVMSLSGPKSRLNHKGMNQMINDLKLTVEQVQKEIIKLNLKA